MKQIIETLKSSDNEGTESPYWLILDPKQNMSCDYHYLASMITGPFFCREDAEAHLKTRRYAFSERAVVYCLSGYWSTKIQNPMQKVRALNAKTIRRIRYWTQVYRSHLGNRPGDAAWRRLAESRVLDLLEAK